MKLLCIESNINMDYGYTRLSFSTLSCDAPEPQSHGMYSTVQLTYIICIKACSWRDVDLCTEMQSTKKVSPFLIQPSPFVRLSSTAALMKLLLPTEIHVAVCDLQATHRPTITGLLLQNCVIQVLFAATWCVEQRRCTGRRPPRYAAIGFWKQYSR